MPNSIPVLMIDDNEDDIVLLRERLAELPDGPYELSSEVDADNAIARVKQINPAVIFLDYRLSTTTGLEVIREMRKLGLLQPVIVLTGQGDDGTVGPSAKMMQAKGIAPLDLAPRDGLSMISHSGPSVALAAFAVYETGVAYEALQTCAALSMEGFRANVGPMDPDVLAVKPHPGQAAAAAGLRHALDGSALWAEGAARRLQDPLSFRNIVHIHGPLHTALDAARDCVLIELNGSSDNPVALIDRAALVSNGAYLAGEIAVMMDYVARAAVPVAMASLARIAKLLNPVFTDLPPFLAMPGSTSNGLAPLTKSAEALVARIVQAAQPTPVWPSVSANGVEDVLTNAPLSAASLRTIAADLVHLAALEALTACQAIDLRGVAPDLGPTLRDTHQAIRAVSDVVTEDRPLSRDINQLTALLRKRSR